MADSGIELLQFTAIIFTLLYFVLSDESMIRKPIVGMISAVIWFGIAALTPAYFTTGYTWAMLYVLIGIILMLLSVNEILRIANSRMSRA